MPAARARALRRCGTHNRRARHAAAAYTSTSAHPRDRSARRQQPRASRRWSAARRPPPRGTPTLQAVGGRRGIRERVKGVIGKAFAAPAVRLPTATACAGTATPRVGDAARHWRRRRARPIGLDECARRPAGSVARVSARGSRPSRSGIQRSDSAASTLPIPSKRLVIASASSAGMVRQRDSSRLGSTCRVEVR